MEKTQSKCNTCQKLFLPKKDTKGLFCSRNCHYQDMRVGERKCNDCGGKTSFHGSLRCKTCEVKRRKGKQHYGWKGALVGYRALHHWVVRELGQPAICESCGCEGTGHKMHWANKSGDYKREINDWLRLCASCHKQYDLERLSGLTE